MYNEPNNLLRDGLLRIGILLYRLGLAKFVLQLRPNRVRAILYHAVEEHESPYTQQLGVSVSPAMFDANLAYFTRFYNVIDVNQLGQQDTAQKTQLPRLCLPDYPGCRKPIGLG